MRTPEETAECNRLLKAYGIGTLEESGTIVALARLVDGHQHFMQMLSRLPPEPRREMYEAMIPHLLFRAHPLDTYVAMAKERAQSLQYPVIDEKGNLQPYTVPRNALNLTLTPEEDEDEWAEEEECDEFARAATCRKCNNRIMLVSESRKPTNTDIRNHGWAYDEEAHTYLCPDCLNKAQP